MARPGTARDELAQTLNAAYGAGLLSETTLVYRLEQLLTGLLIDPARLVGDLSRRTQRRGRIPILGERIAAAARRACAIATTEHSDTAILQLLDWTGGEAEILIGRSVACDVVLSEGTVSRRHAQLRFRDGGWVLRDLESRNGTAVNGRRVGRCELHPGDEVAIGGHLLRVD